MIELHCHMSPGIDDGPKTDDETLALARALRDAGVTKVACTPHVRTDKGWKNTRAVQTGLHQKLDRLFAAHDIDLPHFEAAEHYLDDTLFEEPLDARLVPYQDTQWLLVELPYHGEPVDLFGQLFKLRKRGYRLLLAHLERFPYACDDLDKVERLVNAGYAIQINLGSLAGGYNRAQKKAAEKLLKAGFAHVACGDCHRAPDVKKLLEKGQKRLKKLAGEAGYERLCVTNPQHILDDAPPERFL